jgi:hypothetical protein
MRGFFTFVVGAKLPGLEVETLELKHLIASAWAFNPSLMRQIIARLERLSSRRGIRNYRLPERTAASESRMEASRIPFECGEDQGLAYTSSNRKALGEQVGIQ